MKRSRKSINDEVADLASENPLLTSYLSLSGNEIRKMSPELLVHELIKNNLSKFTRLMLLNKELREIIESVDDLYVNLLKYVFPNYYVALYEWSYMSRDISNIRMRNDNFIDNTSEFDGICAGKQNLYDLTVQLKTIFSDPMIEPLHITGLFKLAIVPLQSIDHVSPNGSRIHRYLYLNHALFQRCRKDFVFAKQVSRLYAIISPFGLPHASYYLNSHARLRRIMMSMVVDMMAFFKHGFDPKQEQDVTTSPLGLFLRELEKVGINNVLKTGNIFIFAYKDTLPEDTDEDLDQCETIDAAWLINFITTKVKPIIESMKGGEFDDEYTQFYSDNPIMTVTLPALEQLLSEKDDTDDYFYNRIDMSEHTKMIGKVIMGGNYNISDVHNEGKEKILKHIDIFRDITFNNETIREIDEFRRKLVTYKSPREEWKEAKISPVKQSALIYRKLFYKAVSLEKDNLHEPYFSIQGKMDLCDACFGQAFLEEEGVSEPRLFCSKTCQEKLSCLY